MLLCDLHIHTKYSDGSVGLKEAVDLFGQSGFDVIAITDHIVNDDNLFGKLTHYFGFTVNEQNFARYMSDIQNEARRAWEKYGMLVIPGVEISKNYLSADESAHVLIVDIKEFISASLSYEEIFLQAKEQNALVIACHPHHSSEITMADTLFLWNNKDKYSKYIDAWEVASRNDTFSTAGIEKYPHIAGSDFHRIHHIYSWKTLLNCEKDIEHIKRCIKHGKEITVTLFKE